MRWTNDERRARVFGTRELRAALDACEEADAAREAEGRRVSYALAVASRKGFVVRRFEVVPGMPGGGRHEWIAERERPAPMPH